MARLAMGIGVVQARMSEVRRQKRKVTCPRLAAEKLSNCPSARSFPIGEARVLNVLAHETDFIFAPYEHDCICRIAARQ